MNLKSKVNEAMSQIRSIEGHYVDNVKTGSKDMDDYLQVRYYSGLRNGFEFFRALFEQEMTEETFDKMLKEVLYQEQVN